MSLASRIVKALRGDRLSREIEELASHIADASDTNRDRGEARAFGSVQLYRGASGNFRVILWLDSLRGDFVVAWRRLRESKVTSAAAILSLALGIGACLAAFQLVDALLLRPLPIAAPDRLYALSRQEFQMNGQSTTRDTWEYPLFREMRAGVASQATLIAISDSERVEITFRSDREMERAHVQYVSGDMFDTFGLYAASGRLLSQNDDLQLGAHPVAVVSHDYWSRRFAQDPQVIGRTFRITNSLTGSRIYQIVGVAGVGFTGTEPGKVVDIFLPAMMHWGMSFPEWSLFRTFVHLEPGISASPVRDHLSGIVRAFNDSKANRVKQALEMSPAPAGVSAMQKDYRTSLAALGVLVVLVLLIACANVTNLMTAQAAARTREMALRVSIGAGRWRLGQLVLVEAAIIGLFASAVGWCFAHWSAPLVLARVNPPDNPARLSLAMDLRALAFAVVLTLFVSLLFGVAPALRASAIRPVEVLGGGDGSHSRARWMRALIALQAAFCFVVLFVAGLFVATFDRLHGQPNGFSSERIVNIAIVNPRNEPSTLWDQVADHIRTMPGIQAVAYADWPLLDGYGFKTDAISVNSGPPSEVPAWFMNVSPGWLDTMKIPFITGRDFRPTDRSPGVAIVNEAFARQFFAHENPVGQWFEGTSGWMRGQKFQIVGLVHDARYRYLRQSVLPVAYTPFRRTDAKGTMQGGTLVVRTSTSNPLALASILRNEIPRTRPEFRVSNMRTQQELIDSQTIRERLLAMLARFFGAVALLLAGVGLYGVLDYSVLQRRREIGIRMALGAQPRDLAVRVTARVFSMVLVGALTGLALGLASVRYIEPLLYQVRSTELTVLAMPALAILGAAVLAALPAVIHAVEIDPATLLRAE
jgi:predicted permease